MRRAASEKSGGSPAQAGGGGGDGGDGGDESGPQTSDASVGTDNENSSPDEEDPSFVARTDPAGEQETVIPPETSDTDSLMRLAQWNQLPVFASGRLREQNVQDRGTGSREESAIYPTLADGNRDVSNFICPGAQATIGNGDIPYLFDEGSCPEPYVRGVEMARFTGSGRMVRLWMTGTGLSPGPEIRDEWLRIYVDDNPRPILQLPAIQLMGGSTDEIFATPFGSGSRNVVAWHYPVVFSTKLVVALDYLSKQYFYEIDAVLDDEPRRRVAGGTRRAARDRAHARLANPSPVPQSAAQLLQEAIVLAPGEQRHIELAGPATIHEMVLRVPQDKLSNLRGVRITGRWDDASAAAIELPLLSLFASALTVPEANSLALTARVEGSDVVLGLRLPMPFHTKAAWDIANAGMDPAELTLTWDGEAGVPAEPFGQLHAVFKDSPIPLTQNEQGIASLNGRGRVVGLCADLMGRRESSVLGTTLSHPLDLCRGDFRYTADGEIALQSTSTDHYANTAMYFTDAPSGTPFAQAWGRTINESEARGQVGFCRWHVLGNEIDFNRTLSVTHEAVQRDLSIIDLHRTVVYVYLE